MKALIERVEAATAEMQGAILEEAWEACASHSAEFRAFATAHCSGFGTNAGKFSSALDARAYESAALMLVPQGYDWAVFRTNGGLTIHAWCGDRTDVFAATPALALCAAALRAQSTGENGHE